MRAQFISGGRQLAVAVEQAPHAQSLDRLRTTAPGSSRAGVCPNSGAKPVPVATWVISASMPLEPVRDQRGYIAVTAILPQQGDRMPQLGVRRIAANPIPRVRHTTAARRHSGSPRRSDAQSRWSARIAVTGNPLLPQNRWMRFVPIRAARAGDVTPRRRECLRYQLGVEVIERRRNDFRGDRPDRRRPARRSTACAVRKRRAISPPRDE